MNEIVLLQLYTAICDLLGTNNNLDITFEVIKGHHAKLVLQIQFKAQKEANDFAIELAKNDLKSKTNANKAKAIFHNKALDKHCVHFELDEVEKFFSKFYLHYDQNFQLQEGFKFNPQTEHLSTKQPLNPNLHLFPANDRHRIELEAEQEALKIIADHEAYIHVVQPGQLDFYLDQINDPQKNRPSRALFRRNIKKNTKIKKANPVDGTVKDYIAGIGQETKLAQNPDHVFNYTKKYSATLIPPHTEIMNLYADYPVAFGWFVPACLTTAHIYLENKITNKCQHLITEPDDITKKYPELLTLPLPKDFKKFTLLQASTLEKVRERNKHAMDNGYRINWNEILVGFPKKRIDFLFTQKEHDRIELLFSMYHAKKKINSKYDIPLLIFSTTKRHELYSHSQRLKDIQTILLSKSLPDQYNSLTKKNWKLLKKILESSIPKVGANADIVKELTKLSLPNLNLGYEIAKILASYQFGAPKKTKSEFDIQLENLQDPSQRMKALDYFYTTNTLETLKKHVQGKASATASISQKDSMLFLDYMKLLRTTKLKCQNAEANAFILNEFLTENKALAHEWLLKVTTDKGKFNLSFQHFHRITLDFHNLAQSDQASIDNINLFISLAELKPLSCSNIDDDLLKKSLDILKKPTNHHPLSLSEFGALSLYAHLLSHLEINKLILALESCMSANHHIYASGFASIMVSRVIDKKDTIIDFAIKHKRFELFKYICANDNTVLAPENKTSLLLKALTFQAFNIAEEIIAAPRNKSELITIIDDLPEQYKTEGCNTLGDSYLDASIMNGYDALTILLANSGAKIINLFSIISNEKNLTKKRKMVNSSIRIIHSLSKENRIELLEIVSDPTHQLTDLIPSVAKTIDTLENVVFKEKSNPLYYAVNNPDLFHYLLITKNLTCNIDNVLKYAIEQKCISALRKIALIVNKLSKDSLRILIEYALNQNDITLISEILGQKIDVPDMLHYKLLLYVIKHIEDENISPLISALDDNAPLIICAEQDNVIFDAVLSINTKAKEIFLLFTQSDFNNWISSHKNEIINAAIKNKNINLIFLIKKSSLFFSHQSPIENCSLLHLCLIDHDAKLINDLFCHNLIDKTQLRQKNLDNLSLAEQAIKSKYFDIAEKMLMHVDSIDDLNISTHYQNELKTYYLSKYKNAGLFYALQNENLCLFNLICTSECDLQALDDNGKTIAEVTLYSNKTAFAKNIFISPNAQQIPQSKMQEYLMHCASKGYFSIGIAILPHIKEFPIDSSRRNPTHYTAMFAESDKTFLHDLIKSNPQTIAEYDGNNNDGETPIYYALKNKNINYDDFEKIYLTAGSLITKKDKSRLFHKSIEDKEFDFAQLIVNDVLKMEDITNKSILPLLVPHLPESKNLFLALCEHGASLLEKDSNGTTALDILIHTKNISLIRSSIKYIIRDADSNALLKLAHSLICNNHDQLLLDILDNRSTIFLPQNNLPTTPADVAMNTQNQLPLHACVKMKKPKLLAVLCMRMNSLDQEDNEGNTALMHAIYRNEGIDEFLKYPTKMSHRHINSAFSLAASMANLHILQQLVKIFNAEIDATFLNKHNIATLEYLVNINHSDIESILKNLFKSASNFKLTQTNAAQVIEKMISNTYITADTFGVVYKYLPLFSSDEISRFLLLACEKNRFDVAQILLSKARLNLALQNAAGKTALHFAVEQHEINSVRSLCKNGANIYIADKNQITPLSIAITRVLEKDIYSPQFDITSDLITTYSVPSAIKSDKKSEDYVGKLTKEKELFKAFATHLLCGNESTVIWLCLNGAIPSWINILDTLDNNNQTLDLNTNTAQITTFKTLLRYTKINSNDEIKRLSAFIALHLNAEITLYDSLLVKGTDVFTRQFKLHVIEYALRRCTLITQIVAIKNVVMPQLFNPQFFSQDEKFSMFTKVSEVVKQMLSTRVLQLAEVNPSAITPDGESILANNSDSLFAPDSILGSMTPTKIFGLFKNQKTDEGKKYLRKEEKKVASYLGT